MALIPVIDDRVKHVGITTLRKMNARSFRDLDHMLVLHDTNADEALAVIIPYPMYLELQKTLWPTSLLPQVMMFLEPGMAAAIKKLNEAHATPITLDNSHQRDSITFAHPADLPQPDPDQAAFTGTLQEALDAAGLAAFEAETQQAPVPKPSLKESGTGGFGTKPGEEHLLPSPLSQVPHCNHCGKPSDTTPCQNCFMAGHRNGDCLKCA